MASRPGEVVTATQLVDELKIPRPFLRKILQKLNKVGLVLSAKGSGGGFRLTRDPEDMSLADIIEAFQGSLRINECVFKKKLCPNRCGCNLKSKIEEIEGHVTFELKSTSIGSLLKKGS